MRVGDLEMHITKKHSEHFPAFIENVIIILIILVIFHTIIEDFAIIYIRDHQFHFWMAVGSILFDFLFTVEFLGRTVISLRHNQFRRYFLKERGWIDALTSFPLLLLVSGPAMYLYLANIHGEAQAVSILTILKTAKAIRVTRILRLIRVIKLFGKIQNTDSVMVGKHVGTVSTIGVVALIFVLAMSSFFPPLSFGDHASHYKQRESELRLLFGEKQKYNPDFIRKYAEMNEDIIKITDAKSDVIFRSEYANSLVWSAYAEPVQTGSYSFLLSYHKSDAEHAKLSLVMLFSILTLILFYMFIYAGLFAKTISDPLFVMNRGMREWDYNLEVRIPEDERDEEVFQLSKIFNQRWLPLKGQIRSYRKNKNQEKSLLKVDDIL